MGLQRVLHNLANEQQQRENLSHASLLASGGWVIRLQSLPLHHMANFPLCDKVLFWGSGKDVDLGEHYPTWSRIPGYSSPPHTIHPIAAQPLYLLGDSKLSQFSWHCLPSGHQPDPYTQRSVSSCHAHSNAWVLFLENFFSNWSIVDLQRCA